MQAILWDVVELQQVLRCSNKNQVRDLNSFLVLEEQLKEAVDADDDVPVRR